MKTDVKPTFVRGVTDAVKPWETSEEAGSKSNTQKISWWQGNLRRAKQEAKPWQNEAKEAWTEFQGESQQTSQYRKLKAWVCEFYNRYWADSMTILPTVYSQVPSVCANTRFEADDVARTACLALENLYKTLIPMSDFDAMMNAAALEFINTNRATARVYFEAETSSRAKRIPLQLAPQPEPQENSQEEGAESPQQEASEPPMYLTEDGEPAPEGIDILQDDNGQPYYEIEGQEEDITNPRVFVRALHFDEYLTSNGARCFDDVWWFAFKVTTTRKQACDLFDPAIVKQIKTGPNKNDNSVDDSDDGETLSSTELFSYWEIWDKREKMTYWVHDTYKKDFLKEPEEDLYEIRNFWPCARFAVTNERYKDIYTTPDYTQCKDTYQQIHSAARRLNIVINSIKCTALYAKDIPELEQMFDELQDGEGIAVSNFKDLLDKGGLDQLIMYPNYQMFSGILQDLTQTLARLLDDISKLRGLPEIMQGQAQSDQTATATLFQRAASNSRSDRRTKAFEKFGRDTLEIMGDLALKTFTDEELYDAMGCGFMSPEDQQRYPQALALLKDDTSRFVRIDIETDSMIAFNEDLERQSALDLLQVIATSVVPLSQAMQQTPELSPVIANVLELTISKFKFGKHVQDKLNSSLEQLIQKASQPPSQQPPPPDPRIQVAQMQIQSDQQKAQIQNQLEYSKAQMDMQKAQMNASIEDRLNQMEMQFKQWQVQQELALKRGDLGIAQQDSNTATRAELFNEQLQQSTLGLNFQKAQAEVQQQEEEQRRLAVEEIQVPEERMQSDQKIAEIHQMMSSGAGSPQPVTINVQGGTPGQPVPIPIPSQPQIIPVPQPQPGFAGLLG